MTCRDIENFLRKHPGGNLSDEAAEHLHGCDRRGRSDRRGRCDRCCALYRELQGLDTLLTDLPAADLPPYFAARLQARMRAYQRPAPDIRPLWVPLAAAAAGLALVLLTANRFAPDQTNVSRHDQPGTTTAQPAVPAPGAVYDIAAASGTRIYPVWPADQDVVGSDDLTITASLYPAASGAHKVRITIDDQDLTGDSEITGDYLAVAPKGLSPGEHVVTVSYAPADGQSDRHGRCDRQSVTWSFYLLEDAS